ncbi:Maf family protein [Alteromonas lipolytica]|uniref:7-methyl-GTP pyrophosphatase n=1 Tax=Alteromonas lipolytica TaxID=1856405 RepID=A0A1E8FIS3_9ALTE|nr:nucleoside triphosphate pyrophosphatase [Alteromonas lipolytica]OFI35804.1 septum formation protein Maf [Alteromonas lipolytica]GGF80966.1 Maf-like protein [Alteromonas lipolytica]
MTAPRIILASSSAYRRAQLANIGFQVPGISPNIDETAKPNETPQDLACRLSLEKARAVGSDYPDAVIIGGDQVATVTDGAGKQHILGKPGTLDKAMEQLELCSGNKVRFITALSLVHEAGQREQTQFEDVFVTFSTLSDSVIERYLLKEQPYDCAGSFKAEGAGVLLFDRIDSRDPNTLIGLPVMLLRDMLANWQINLLDLTFSHY